MTLDEALMAVAQAAQDWGVRSHEREGRFVSALMVAIRSLGGLTELTRAEFSEMCRQGLEASKLERDRTRDLARATEAALGQARSAIIVADVERDRVVTTMVDKTIPLFAKHLRDVMVIREQRWNRDQVRRRYALGAAVGLGVFLGGYALAKWQSWSETAFAESCLEHPASVQGHTVCVMDALAASNAR